MKALVFAAGAVHDYERVRARIGQPDLVICADGGMRHARALGLAVDLVLGDFDSIDPALLETIQREGVPVMRVPAEKDQTDTELALREALRRGATTIILIGASGDRLDHTIANVLLLPGIPDHVDMSLIDDKNSLRLLRPGTTLQVTGQPGEYVSLLPLTPEVCGVTFEGVRWPLVGATLRWGESLGISNRLSQPEATVSIVSGCLLVICARD